MSHLAELATDVRPRGVRCAVVGVGYWGRHFVRLLQDLRSARLVGVVDIDPTTAERLHGASENVRLWSPDELLARSASDLDAVVIATPASTHGELARRALERGWHVFVEKPFVLSSDEAAELSDLSGHRGCVLMVGHTFLYHPAIQAMKAAYDQGTIGRARMIRACRSLAPIRSDVDVIWDLATHDVAIMSHLLGGGPVSVSALGASLLTASCTDAASVNLVFPGDVVASLYVSWTDVTKVRRFEVLGSEGSMIFDDTDPLRPLSVYGNSDRAASISADDVYASTRRRLVQTPELHHAEALRLEIEQFLRCILVGEAPLLPGRASVEVVRTLEAIQRSIRAGGTSIACGERLYA
jgi:predicted dehydrogenase